MDEATLGPELLCDGVDERGRVVVSDLLDLGDAPRCGDARVRTNDLRGLGRDRSDLRARIERRELDVEPGTELALVRPDACHGRARVAGDHRVESSLRPGCSASLGGVSFRWPLVLVSEGAVRRR